ncbi:MAG TPA: glycosyltransferase family 39 protein [Thermoanaerobaculia bacterium]|jgi:4-amino-4-deoxy-L-arabinose transferase-like glycosyltransferase|nr:glycosyltransferase family 39 protein [Thermoanaerobaculia bacterium]
MTRRTLLLLVAILLFGALVRVRLLDLPLERDEGEYAYAGQLMLQGIPPYQLVYNMKFPGTYAAYAGLMAVFGETVGGIRFGLLLITAATALLVYFLARRFYDDLGALTAAAVYTVLSLGFGAMGPYAHATHFVALMATAAMLLLARDRPLLAGVFFGLAVLMKQPGIFFALFALTWLVATKRRKDAVRLIAGGAAVAMATVVVLAAAGVFSRFWFWTIRYAQQYAAIGVLAEGIELLNFNLLGIVKSAPLLWVLVVAGLVIAGRRSPGLRPPSPRGARRGALAPNAGGEGLLLGFFGASLLAVMPGFYFREHYFLVTFPPAALLAGAAIDWAAKRFGARTAAVAIGAALVISIGAQWGRWMRMPAEENIRTSYPGNPFVEAPVIADYLREHTRPEERIAVLGSEPEIFFYAKRKSATGYIYTYALTERQPFATKMTDEYIAEVENAKPRYVVMVSSAQSWLMRPDADKRISEWMLRHLRHGYVLEGVAEIRPGQETVYRWGEEARRTEQQSKNVLMIFRATS